MPIVLIKEPNSKQVVSTYTALNSLRTSPFGKPQAAMDGPHNDAGTVIQSKNCLNTWDSGSRKDTIKCMKIDMPFSINYSYTASQPLVWRLINPCSYPTACLGTGHWKGLGMGQLGPGIQHCKAWYPRVMYWRKQSSDRLPGHMRLPENVGYWGQNQIREGPQWESNQAESLRVKTVEEMSAGRDLNLTVYMQATVSPGNCSLPKLVL